MKAIQQQLSLWRELVIKGHMFIVVVVKVGSASVGRQDDRSSITPDTKNEAKAFPKANKASTQNLLLLCVEAPRN